MRYTRENDLVVDPMCGSGTIAIEAALWARNIAPGLLRKHYGFQRWALYDATRKNSMIAIREQANERVVAEWLVDGRPSMDLTLFDPARFGTGHASDRDPGPDAE